MSTPLPADGPQRDIFVRALRDYSDHCRSPNLTPSCPFYRQPQGDSGPWCFEECMDLLAAHPEPAPAGQLVLDGGFAAYLRRPRARRGGTAPAKPFDARELYLEDRKRASLGSWRPASLITSLLSRLSTPPSLDPAKAAQRHDRVKATLAELERRGIDTEMLMYDGLLPNVAITVVATAAMPLVLGMTGAARPGLEDVVDALPYSPRWVALLLGAERTPAQWLAHAREQGADWAAEQYSKVLVSVPRVANWLSTLGIDALIDWTPPSTVEFGAAASDRPQPSSPVPRWLIDRFTITYLDQWAKSSLRCEWKYLHGRQMAPCSPEAMRTRHISEGDLAAVMADRMAGDDSGDDVSGTLPMSAFRTTALDHLRADRRWAAAAVYDAFRRAAPGNAEAHNNFGFCTLPDDPAAALPALEEAARLGMEDEPVNVGNRMLALERLGRRGTALEVAERFAERGLLARRLRGYLWDHAAPAGGAVLLEDTDTSRYIARFALAIAHNAGEVKAVKAWRSRIEKLEGGTC